MSKRPQVTLSVSGRDYDHSLTGRVSAGMTNDEQAWALSQTAEELLLGLQRLLGTYVSPDLVPATGEDNSKDAPEMPQEERLPGQYAMLALNRAIELIHGQNTAEESREYSLNEVLGLVFEQYAAAAKDFIDEEKHLANMREEEDVRAAEPVAEPTPEPEPELVEEYEEPVEATEERAEPVEDTATNGARRIGKNRPRR